MEKKNVSWLNKRSAAISKEKKRDENIGRVQYEVIDHFTMEWKFSRPSGRVPLSS